MSTIIERFIDGAKVYTFFDIDTRNRKYFCPTPPEGTIKCCITPGKNFRHTIDIHCSCGNQELPRFSMSKSSTEKHRSSQRRHREQ